MLSNKEINVLGNIVDGTFRSGDGVVSLSCSLQGEELLVKYNTVVHFASENALRQQVDRYSDESIQRISSYITDVKSEFKEQSGSTLQLEEVDDKDHVELISATANSPRRIAYYRRQCRFIVKN